MNMYQGLLLLHGFRVLPEDATEGGAGVGETASTFDAAPAAHAGRGPDQFGAGTARPTAGARASCA